MVNILEFSFLSLSRYPRDRSKITLNGDILMIILVVLSILALGWAVWFILEMIRYIISGERSIDIRLNSLKR